MAPILDLDLTSHNCFNNLVTLFLRTTPVDEDALEAVAEYTYEGQVFYFDLRCVAWMQGTENQVKDLLKAKVIAYYR